MRGYRGREDGLYIEDGVRLFVLLFVFFFRVLFMVGFTGVYIRLGLLGEIRILDDNGSVGFFHNLLSIEKMTV